MSWETKRLLKAMLAVIVIMGCLLHQMENGEWFPWCMGIMYYALFVVIVTQSINLMYSDIDYGDY